jgi:PD-(D/E)XK nuclease superfamily protein
MSTAKRGNEAEAMVLSALVQRGYDVSVPFGEGQPYDLLVDLGGRDFLRVQCKRAWPLRGCVVFNSRSTDHGRGPQSYIGLADIFGVYFPPASSVYLVPLDAIATCEGRLRLEPARNNQRRRIRLAEEYEIDRWSHQALRSHLREAVVEPEPEPNFA